MSYEKEKNIAGETEMLSSDEQNVSRLLSNLKRVDAPKDFDFHLKARLANASPGDYRPVRLFPILKYVLPLALFLFVGAAFVLTNSYTGVNVSVVEPPDAPVTSMGVNSVQKQQTVVNNDPTRVPENILVENPQANTRLLVTEQTKEPKLPRSNRPEVGNRNGGGSYVTTARNATAPISAPVIADSNSNSVRNPGNPGPSIPLQFRQMLVSLGIDASDAGDKTWKVMRLAKDGIAERSGLQVGDMMEAIDDKPITPLYDGSFSVKSISVRRDDKVVKIDIQPNKP
ncbi:MAG: PDZ domain-containing protein [Pyrinomonadaceae bacterium]